MEEGIRPVAEGGVVAGAAPVPAPGGTTAAVGPPSAPDPTAAAFFDVDNTVIRGASIFVLARGLWRRDFFGLRDIAAMAWKQARFIAVGENLAHVARIREQAPGVGGGALGGRDHRSSARRSTTRRWPGRIWPGTRALAMGHLARGQEVWLVTATPVEVAQVIARRLGLSGALGTVAESVDGVYTGRLVGEPLHGPAKAAAVAALAHDEGPGPVPVRGLLRLGQRHPDALARRPPVRGQPRRGAARSTPARTAGRSWTTAGDAGPRRSACAPQPPRPSPARSPPRPTAAAADRRRPPPATGRTVRPNSARVPEFGQRGASGREGGQKKTERRCISSA